MGLPALALVLLVPPHSTGLSLVQTSFFPGVLHLAADLLAGLFSPRLCPGKREVRGDSVFWPDAEAKGNQPHPPWTGLQWAPVPLWDMLRPCRCALGLRCSQGGPMF